MRAVGVGFERAHEQQASHARTPARVDELGDELGMHTLESRSVVAWLVENPHEITGALGISVSGADFAARRWELERVVRAAGERASAAVVEAERAAAGS